jgi:hypothetical protein
LYYCIDEEIDFLSQVAISSSVEYASGASDRLFRVRMRVRMRMRMKRAGKNLATMVMNQVRIYHTWFVSAILCL